MESSGIEVRVAIQYDRQTFIESLFDKSTVVILLASQLESAQYARMRLENLNLKVKKLIVVNPFKNKEQIKKEFIKMKASYISYSINESLKDKSFLIKLRRK